MQRLQSSLGAEETAVPDTLSPALEKRPRSSRGRSGKLALGLLPELVGYNLRKAQIAVFQNFQAAVSPHDITPGQFGVLTLIRENSGLSQSELGTAVGIDRSTMVAVIDRLESRGLVVRAPSPRDRRSYALRLSPEGERLLDDVVPRIRAHEKTMTKDLSRHEVQALITLLAKVARNGGASAEGIVDTAR